MRPENLPDKQKTTAASIRNRIRRHTALKMRKEGRTYPEIGEELGISKQRANQIVRAELEIINKDLAEEVEELRRLELERLDALFRKAFEAATTGGSVLLFDPKATEACLKIMDRRTKLLGMDAPTKIEEVGEGGGVVFIMPEDYEDPAPDADQPPAN